MTTPVTNDPFAALQTNGTAQTKNDAAAADRFLKLLVTQMQNQDPLNPMDNAQITSQMAQINTVSGIEKLNTTVEGLNGQFVQMQALQGASLVGRDIMINSNLMAIEGGAGGGTFDLAGTADSVKAEVLDPSGRVVDTINLGSLAAGRHDFEWTGSKVAGLADSAQYSFRLVAKQGTATVTTTPLLRDHVRAVSTQGDRLILETQFAGNVAYADVKAFN